VLRSRDRSGEQVAVGCATPVLEYVPEGAEEPVKVRAPHRLRTALFGRAPETKPASCRLLHEAGFVPGGAVCFRPTGGRRGAEPPAASAWVGGQGGGLGAAACRRAAAARGGRRRRAGAGPHAGEVEVRTPLDPRGRCCLMTSMLDDMVRPLLLDVMLDVSLGVGGAAWLVCCAERVAAGCSDAMRARAFLQGE
jgi:hypothetical protein